jgi:ParB/RepB/Spo0J family partition protein
MSQSVTLPATPVSNLTDIPVGQIVPSPFQHRRSFEREALRELGRSIAADGLLQPITVRRVPAGYQLIAGERRWHAVREHTDLPTILARVLDVDDLQARRLCAVENLQRADLTAIEEITALVELIDAEMLASFPVEYPALAHRQDPKVRVKTLLTKLESFRKITDRKEQPTAELAELCSKFTAPVKAIMAGLPKPKDLVSFSTNDLPLLAIPDPVQSFAIAEKLNKSQTAAVADFAKADPKAFGRIVSLPELAQGPALIAAIKRTGVEIDAKDETARDLSASDIRKAARYTTEPLRHDTIATKWTGDAESYTPAKFIECARDVLGTIDCDPASNALAQQTVKAGTYYTTKTDGLTKDWKGCVFLNPPYEHPTIADFIYRLLDQLETGNTTAAILLTNNNTDTIWFHKAADKAAAICFTRARINFYKQDGSTTQPTNGQAFFYFGPAVERFTKVFAEHVGLVVTVSR